MIIQVKVNLGIITKYIELKLFSLQQHSQQKDYSAGNLFLYTSFSKL